MSKPRSGAHQAPACDASFDEAEACKLWIHCSRCYELFVEKKFAFFLLACHHVFCEKCIKVAAGRTPTDAPIYECSTCKQSVRGRQLTNTMPKHFKDFFHPEPHILADDFTEKFQRRNHLHFDRFKERKEMEMNKLSKDIELAKSLCQKRLLEMQMLRVERKKLSQRMRHIKLANQKAEMQRSAQAKLNRSLETTKSSSPAPVSIRGRIRGRGASQAPSRRSSKDSIRSSQANRRQVTGFRHQPNHSFNL
ncbi:RING finger protein vilya [Drosophila subpulchrella]|uniref:RING finger protein vilya n=1 Tax=Drosophila subpulchrella TaxID=1486046 RepID=UPI0018A1A012|nr:RING finger protein vilya [Drosophila subpulchrella]